MVPVQRPQHRWPRLTHDQQATLVRTQTLAVASHNVGNNSRQRPTTTARLRRGHPRQRTDHDRARFCLPPGVHNRTTLLTNHLVIPHPRFRIDRLSHRSQQTQTGKIMLLRPLIAPFDKRPNRRRCRVEDAHSVLLDDLPEPPFVRPVRRPFIHHNRRTIRQRAVTNVTVPRDPPDVRRAPVRVVLFQVEHPARGHRRPQQVARGGMQHALRLSRAARCVQNEQRMLAVQRHRITVRRHALHQFVPPEVPVRHHVHFTTRPPDHNHLLHRRTLVQTGVHGRFQRHLFPTPPSAIRGHHNPGPRIIVAVGHRF